MEKRPTYASTKYMNTFFSWVASTELMPFFRGDKGRTAKEVTESLSCYEAVRKHVNPDVKDENVAVVVVGDGVKPRTGSVFAYMTKWQVYSIDPIMNLDWWRDLQAEKTRWGVPTKNLTVIADAAEKSIIPLEGKEVILVFPHSHAPMEEVVSRYRKQELKSLHVISLPCCEKQSTELLRIPHIHYADENVWSPKNEVFVWKNLCLKATTDKS